MKKLQVTVVRRTYSTYDVEVGDSFDVEHLGAFRELEDDYFENSHEWVLIDEETANWEIDSAEEIDA